MFKIVRSKQWYINRLKERLNKVINDLQIYKEKYLQIELLKEKDNIIETILLVERTPLEDFNE